ncbi:hypothetical protein [Flavobacterium silvaticum]|uniref:Uncharacterized protein n=1 Tax=Flavobacterium silvaticum TaxID=1852020 RepID=A0A972JIX8_9FLAO|nr:hypothetical protein [Flavobacterium silvaticum]NMH27642.1 hypothetical protein [Flavobacterium silvaticum]
MRKLEAGSRKQLLRKVYGSQDVAFKKIITANSFPFQSYIFKFENI